jgi:hypothetical protein
MSCGETNSDNLCGAHTGWQPLSHNGKRRSSMKPACQTTHPQIASGKCPWCGCLLDDNEPRDGPDERVWNIAAMAAALDDAAVDVRMLTVTNLAHDGPPLSVALPLLSKSLHDKSERVCSRADASLSGLGRKLSGDDARRFEAQIPGSPHELALRILLLSYLGRVRYASESARRNRNEHVFWLIQHAPESYTAGSPYAELHERDDAEAYAKAKQLWLDQVQAHPETTNVLGNAANFFILSDRQLSEELFKKARDLEPSNPHWPERLGHLYGLGRRQETVEGRTNAANAFREYQAAERLRQQEASSRETEADPKSAGVKQVRYSSSEIRSLTQLARAAFDASEFEEARNGALELLEKVSSADMAKSSGNDGNAIHYANLILGRLALHVGEVEAAKQYLIASGKTSGSPTLCSFGPNMSLAKELLEHGEHETVLRYFDLCRIFWQSNFGQLDEWTREVRAGKIPEFGANLIY